MEQIIEKLFPKDSTSNLMSQSPKNHSLAEKQNRENRSRVAGT